MRYDDEFGNHMGETLLPELDVATELHKCRYNYARDDTNLKGIVLDLGCGIGYGSEILLQVHNKWIGIDKYEMRKKRFERDFANDKTTFIVQNGGTVLPFEDNRFDSAVCFEAIEHINNDIKAISEIYRVLKVGGQFFCSTPLSKGMKGHYHVREYSIEKFKKLIETAFRKVQYFGQNHNSIIDENLNNGSIYILCKATK